MVLNEYEKYSSTQERGAGEYAEQGEMKMDTSP